MEMPSSMNDRVWPDAQRFFAAVGEHGELTIDEIEDQLTAEGYWPASWSIARRRAHIRWMMRTGADEHGTLRFLPVEPDRLELTPSSEQVREILEVIDAPQWQTLEEIRQRLEGAGWFPPGMTERTQVTILEHLLGTEEDPPDPTFAPGDAPLVACIIDPNVTAPEPVYKPVSRLTQDEWRLFVEHLQMRQDEIHAILRPFKSPGGEHLAP